AGLSPDGKMAFTAGRDNTIRAWDVGTGQELRRFGDPANTPAPAAYSPDCRLLATARHDDGIIQVWDLAAGKLLREIEARHSGIASIVCTRDGKTLVSFDNEETVCQWEAATGKKLREWKAAAPEEGQRMRIRYSGAFKPIACSPDGKQIATSGFDFG